jgi:hypothetical protein
MNANALAKQYTQLTGEERFRLLLAAHERGDAQEQDRLISAAKRLYFSEPDAMPFVLAFELVARFAFLDLMEETAKHYDAWERWNEADEHDYIRGKKRKSAGKQDGPTIKEQCELMYLAQGFVLQTKAAAWKLFCERIGIAPFVVWKDLPGFERLRNALLVEGTADEPGPAFSRADMVKWMTRRWPDRKPEITEADISAERLADETEAVFRDRASRFGAA